MRKLAILLCLLCGCGALPENSLSELGVESGGSLGGTGIFSKGGNPDGGNPATRPTPGFTEVEVKPATSTTGAGGSQSTFQKFLTLNLGGVEIDEIRMVVQNFDFDNSVSTGLEGPGFAILRLVKDGLIVDESIPLLGSVILPEGNYSTLDLQFKILGADEIPAGALDDPVVTGHLVGRSIVVEGSFIYTISVLGIDVPLRIPFRFLSTQTNVVRIETPLPLSFTGLDVNFLFIAQKVQLWFNLTVVNLLQALSLTVLPVVGQTVTGVLQLDLNSPFQTVRNIAIQIEDNINTSMRFAPSADALFQEGDVLEQSFSFEL